VLLVEQIGACNLEAEAAYRPGFDSVRFVEHEPIDEARVTRGDRDGSIAPPLRLENAPSRPRMVSDGSAP